jgi:hypothetical protein
MAALAQSKKKCRVLLDQDCCNQRVQSLRTDRLSPAAFAPTDTRTFISLAPSSTTDDRYSGLSIFSDRMDAAGDVEKQPLARCRRMPLFVTRKLMIAPL